MANLVQFSLAFLMLMVTASDGLRRLINDEGSGSSKDDATNLVCTKSVKTISHQLSDKSAVWTNPGWPNSVTRDGNCELKITLKKGDKKTCGARLTFENFRLAQPAQGVCNTDKLDITSEVAATYCGDEPKESLMINKVEVPQYYKILRNIAKSPTKALTLKLVTNGTQLTRKWRIRIEAVKCSEFDKYPNCNAVEHVAEKTAILIRSFNYPHSQVNGELRRDFDGLTCVVSGNKDKGPLSIRAHSGASEEPAFSLDVPPDSKDTLSRHDKKCKNAYVALLDRSNAKFVKYCGGHCNAKSGVNNDGRVSFATKEPYFKFGLSKTTTFSPGGYRLVISTDPDEIYTGEGDDCLNACINDGEAEETCACPLRRLSFEKL